MANAQVSVVKQEINEPLTFATVHKLVEITRFSIMTIATLFPCVSSSCGKSRNWWVLNYGLFTFAINLTIGIVNALMTASLFMGWIGIVQGLFVPFARIGSGDPLRVLHLFHNEYTGYNWSIYCWDFVQLVTTRSNVLFYLSPTSVRLLIWLLCCPAREWTLYCTRWWLK